MSIFAMCCIFLFVLLAAAGVFFPLYAKKRKNNGIKDTGGWIKTYGEVKSVKTERRGNADVKVLDVEYAADGTVKRADGICVRGDLNVDEGQILVVIYDPNNESKMLLKEREDSKDYMNA